MADATEIDEQIRKRTAPAFRGSLLARGQARSLVWRDGLVPKGGPNFSDHLSYDLLTYGYGLLGEGLRLIDLEGASPTTSLALERAAESLESVLRNGDGQLPERDLNVLVAAAAYHVGGFAARAYSLLDQQNFGEAHPASGQALVFLMLRRLDHLEHLVSQTLPRMDVDVEPPLPSTDAELHEMAYEVLDDLFLQAMSTALTALEHGSQGLLQESLKMLEESAALAGAGGYVEQWWIHRLARFVLDGLWRASLHLRIPLADDHTTAPWRWDHLRLLFITSLLNRERAEIELWPSQLEAAEQVFGSDDSLVVSLPTSAGKTRIAELCILKALAEGRRVAFVTPLKALSAQTERSLSKTFAPLGVSVSSLYGGIGMTSVDEDLAMSVEILVATPEKLDFAIRSDPNLLDNVGLIVLDEGHMIGTGEREIRYEAQVQRLLHRSDAKTRRIVCLSAVLPSGEALIDFCGWMSGDAERGLVTNEWTPTRRRFGSVTWNGTVGRLELELGGETAFVPALVKLKRAPITVRRSRTFPQDQGDLTLSVAWAMADEGHSVLIYSPQKNWVVSLAKKVVELIGLGLLTDFSPQLTDKYRNAVTAGEELFGAQHPVVQCLRRGVAVHHGSLPAAFRSQIEELLREGAIRMTISSPTLAQGVNLSATSLVFHSLSAMSGSDFRNVVGRAGRAYADVEGLVILPVFVEDKRKQRRQLALWADLKSGSREMDVRSGLVRLVAELLSALQMRTGAVSLAEQTEYLVNQPDPFSWAKGGESSVDIVQQLDALDIAILSLLGDEGVPEAALLATLDEVLQSSLWSRTLSRLTQGDQDLRTLLLRKRATYIWESTSANQRRALYLAGIGLSSSEEFRAVLPKLALALEAAEVAVAEGNEDLAPLAITAFAATAFQCQPFVPKALPTRWREMLTQWIRGEALTVAEDEDPLEAMDFVEGAVGYRLVWALEAVRVMSPLFDKPDLESDSEAFSLLVPGNVVAAVQAGTLNTSAQTMLQAGLASREVARIVVADFAPTFSSVQQMTLWLKSESVALYSEEPTSPTSKLHDIWLSFVERSSFEVSSAWSRREYDLEVDWFEESPTIGWPLIVRHNSLDVRSADFTLLGHLRESIKVAPGRLQAYATGPTTMRVVQIGPDDAPSTEFF
ncbi:DEAD/DEAH box helicase [Cryobacterium roopkundense]|uniref:DEAD/DEAH box helicase n=1 Tax=Cryobacterium roopkundense TaxID=1001240 RepID=A0A7W9E4J2_9MICO|nr:DEAD/DEAH box helicase [Cryobacterium roopkundense]MBB5640990.1 hypothetical protein [Cryobacterium roopkundense]